ncbi:MAG: AbrB/MazE/SpoVT family DNA-binding domain-containing protein [Candidatus Poribacteria bacterium]
MEIKVKKWGNSLALRIPKPYADKAGLKNDSQVELSIVDGKLVIAPSVEAKFSLEQLLAQVTKDNLHDEFDTGTATGREVW